MRLDCQTARHTAFEKRQPSISKKPAKYLYWPFLRSAGCEVPLRQSVSGDASCFNSRAVLNDGKRSYDLPQINRLQKSYDSIGATDLVMLSAVIGRHRH